jgi:hypothetical protein
MQKFRALQRVDICKQIFVYLSSYNFPTGEVPSKEERAGVHRNGVPTVRHRKRRWTVVFNGGGVAPVVVDERGEFLQLEGDPGVRRRRSIEGWSSSEGRSPEGGRQR